MQEVRAAAADSGGFKKVDGAWSASQRYTWTLLEGSDGFMPLEKVSGFVWSGVFIWSRSDWKSLDHGAVC